MTWVRAALGREPIPHEFTEADIKRIQDARILITGGLGSLGLATFDALEQIGIDAITVDIDEMDVTDPVQTQAVLEMFQPSMILHLAGAKHAPLGELDPLEPVTVHIDGTRNVLEHAPEGCVVVTASTCKSCDPETAYGATKLVAERLTLNAGGRVARFHNVVETQGNVFELWRGLETGAPIPVADCRRYFVSTSEAVSLLLYAALAPSGRYSFYPGDGQGADWMHTVAARLYPGRAQELVPPRRGDRLSEPFMAMCETEHSVAPNIVRVTNPHDPVVNA